MKILLDSDGVLAWLEKRYEELYGPRPFCPIEREQHFWKNWDDFVLNGHFETLELQPGALELLEGIDDLNVETEILSSSGGKKHHDLVSIHKHNWFNKQGILYPRNIVPGGRKKAAFAHDRAVLIDDHLPNIEKFIAAGGHGIYHTDVKKTLLELYALYEILHQK